MTDFDALLAAGAPCLTDDGINLTSAGLCRRAMVEAAKRDVILSFHEEEPSLVPSPGVNYGSEAAKKFGVPGAMAAAETSMIARDIALALDTGARVLFQHVSSGQSAALIRAGKALGAKIYAEVTPHHLSLTEDDVPAHGTCARMNPPLRREADRQALIEALADGTIDMIATDHAPHTAEEKARDFAKAPSGITGLETAFSVCNTYLVKTGRLTRMQLLEKMSRNPAEVYGLTGRAVREGNYARLVLLDWDSEKNVGIITHVISLLNDHESVMLVNQNAELQSKYGGIGEASIAMFREDRALFWIEMIYASAQQRDMNSDFGFLPMPKYDDRQESYMSYMHMGWSTTSAVPVTNDDHDLTGRLLEDMAWKSSETVRPAYYDRTLQGKISRDDDSGEMLDIIYSGLNIDPSIIMAASLPIDAKMRGFLIDGKDSFISEIAANKEKCVGLIEKINTTVEEVLQTQGKLAGSPRVR